jgi:hypothetical protein
MAFTPRKVLFFHDKSSDISYYTYQTFGRYHFLKINSMGNWKPNILFHYS